MQHATPTQLKEMIENYQYRCFNHAAAKNYVDILDIIIAYTSPDQQREALFAYNHDALRKAQEKGYLEIIRRLQALYTSLSINPPKRSLASSSLESRSPKRVQQPEEQPEEQLEFYFNWLQAIQTGNVAFVSATLKNATPLQLNKILSQQAFQCAAENNYLDILNLIATYSTPANLNSMIRAQDYSASEKAAIKGHLGIVLRIMELSMTNVSPQPAVQLHIGSKALCLAIQQTDITALERVLACAPQALEQEHVLRLAFEKDEPSIINYMLSIPEVLEKAIQLSDIHPIIQQQLDAFVGAELQRFYERKATAVLNLDIKEQELCKRYLRYEILHYSPTRAERLRFLLENLPIATLKQSLTYNARLSEIDQLSMLELIEKYTSPDLVARILVQADAHNQAHKNGYLDLSLRILQFSKSHQDISIMRNQSFLLALGKENLNAMLIILEMYTRRRDFSTQFSRALTMATERGDLAAIQRIRTCWSEEGNNFAELVEKNSFFIFKQALLQEKADLINYFLNIPSVFLFATSATTIEGQNLQEHVYSFIQQKLPTLSDNEAELYCYFLAYLIPLNLPRHTNTIKRLLDISAVRIFVAQHNNLLKLAVGNGNEDAMQLLLAVPEVMHEFLTNDKEAEFVAIPKNMQPFVNTFIEGKVQELQVRQDAMQISEGDSFTMSDEEIRLYGGIVRYFVNLNDLSQINSIGYLLDISALTAHVYGKDFIRDLFIKVVRNNSLDMLNLLTKHATDQQLINLLNKDLFNIAVDNDSLDVLIRLLELSSKLNLKITRVLFGEKALLLGIQKGNLSAIERIMALFTKADQCFVLVNNTYEAFNAAVIGGHSPIIQYFLRYPTVLVYATQIYQKASQQHVGDFVKTRLQNLREQRDKREREHINGIFIFDISSDKATLCSYFLYHLIQLNDRSKIEDMDFLLSIPSVRKLIHREIFNGGANNELLKLALGVGNDAAAALLLAIPEVVQQVLAEDELLPIPECGWKYIDSFIKEKLQTFRSQQEILLKENQDDFFDTHDAIFNLQPSEARLCFTLLRYLFNSGVELHRDSICFLLTIPAVRAMAYLGGSTIKVGEKFDLFLYVAEHNDLDALNFLTQEATPEELTSEKLYAAYTKAEKSGHLRVMIRILESSIKRGAQEIHEMSSSALVLACQNKEFTAIVYILRIFPALNERAQRYYGGQALLMAAEQVEPEGVRQVIASLPLSAQHNVLAEHGFNVLVNTIDRVHHDTTSYLLDFPAILAEAVDSKNEALKPHLDIFIQEKIQNLRARLDTNNSYTLLDEEAKLYYYCLRYLVNLNAPSHVCTIDFLLSIPTIAKLSSTMMRIPLTEPESCDYIYINPVNNRVHLVMPITAGQEISTDGTCKARKALEQFCKTVLKVLEKYTMKLEFDIQLMEERNPERLAKEERLSQMSAYIEAIKHTNSNNGYNDAVNSMLALPSNLYSIQLRPNNLTIISNIVNPVFTIDKSTLEGKPLSVFYNALDEFFSKIGMPVIQGPTTQLKKAVLAALPQKSINFEQIQMELRAQCRKLFNLDIDFTITPILEARSDEARANGKMHFTQESLLRFMKVETEDEMEAESYIDSLIGLCAANLDVSFPTPLFYNVDILEARETLSILTQFLLAVVNVVCREKKISQLNFGKILDGSADLSKEVASIVTTSLQEGSDVEINLIGFFNQKRQVFGFTRALTEEEISEIKSLFDRAYRTVTSVPGITHMDEFMFLREKTKDPAAIFVTHQGSLATSFAHVILAFDQNDVPNQDFFASIREDFRSCSTVIPAKNEGIQKNVEISAEVFAQKRPQNLPEALQTAYERFNAFQVRIEEIKKEADVSLSRRSAQEDGPANLSSNDFGHRLTLFGRSSTGEKNPVAKADGQHNQRQSGHH